MPCCFEILIDSCLRLLQLFVIIHIVRAKEKQQPPCPVLIHRLKRKTELVLFRTTFCLLDQTC